MWCIIFHFFSTNFLLPFFISRYKKGWKRELIWPKKNLEKRSSSSLDQTYSDLTPAESAHTPGFWIYICTSSLETPLASFPPFATVILSVEIGSSSTYIPKELYSVTRKKFGRSPKIYDSLFLLLPLLLLLFFPFRQIKMGTLVLIMNRMTMLFFFLRNDAPL